MTIVMPEIAKVSIFMDNDLTHITDDHFEIKLIARGMMMHHQVNMNIHSRLLVQVAQHPQHRSSQNICIRFLPIHRHKVWLHGKNFL